MERQRSTLCLLVVSACLIAESVARLGHEGIVGGDVTLSSKFPYQISIQTHGQSICGGGIIGNRHILTAAHCVVNENGRSNGYQLRIVAGADDLFDKDENVVEVDVSKIYVLWSYYPPTGKSNSDIAILRLAKSLNLEKNTHLRALKLPENDEETYANKEVAISGYGYDWVTVDENRFTGEVQERGGASDGKLKYAIANVVDNRRCQRLYGPRPVYNNQICAAAKQRSRFTESGVCSGDSGGPLVFDSKTVVGVVSTSPIGCTEAVKPAVYTRVSSFLDFIDNAVKNKVTSDMRVFNFIDDEEEEEEEQTEGPKITQEQPKTTQEQPKTTQKSPRRPTKAPKYSSWFDKFLESFGY